MNLREGTRRLALLLGVAGAIFGGFVSYLQLQSTMRQRTEHKRFEQLAKSAVLAAEGTASTPAPEPRWNPVPEMRAKYPGLRGWTDARILKNLSDPAKFRAEFPQYAGLSDSTIRKNIAILQASSEPSQPKPESFQQKADRIIHWTSDDQVGSIETQDGQTLYPTPAPGAWSYVAIALLPLLGFLVPWGAVRAIGWVLTGFVAGPK